MDGKIMGFTPPDKFSFDIQRFDGNVCKIGNTEYASIKDAVNAVTAGSTATITMISDATINSANKVLVAGKTITLDLDGHTITCSDGTIVVQSENKLDKKVATEAAKNSTKLTLTDRKYGTDEAGKILSHLNGAIRAFGNGLDDEISTPTLEIKNINITCDIVNASIISTRGNSYDWYVNMIVDNSKLTGTQSDTDLSANPTDAGVGIYCPAVANVTIKDSEITAETGVEVRAGSLTLENSKITATGGASGTYAVGANKNGSTMAGVAIAVSQHTTAQHINVSVKGDKNEISGPVALAVANPQGNESSEDSPAAEVEIEGGIFESTGTNEAAIAAQNADSRSTITIKGDTTFIGKLESTFAKATTETASTGIVIEKGAEVTVAEKVTDEEGNPKIVPKQTYTSDSFTYTETWTETVGEKVETKTTTYHVNEGWNQSQATTKPNTFYYLEKVTGQTNAQSRATLAPASGEEANTTLNLTTTTNWTPDGGLAVDLTKEVFAALPATFTKLTTAENTTIPLNITGNDNTTSILGGAGSDTITAIHSVGAFLDGGAGNDYLIGGDGKDIFAFSGGSDTIQDYVYGTDAVSLGGTDSYKLPETFASINNSDGSNFVLAVGTGASLTFRPTTALTIAQPKAGGSGQDIFSYTAGTIAKNDNISLGALYTNKNYDGRELTYKVIDASQVTTTSGINLRANDNASSLIGASMGGALYGGAGADILQASGGNTTLNGGAGSDSLVGGNGADVFIYDGNAGGTDTVSGYGDNDLVNVRNVRLSDAEFKSATADDKINISLEFGGGDNLIFQNVENKVVSVKSGSSYYLYNKNYYAHNKGITLAAGYDDGETDKNYKTFDGASNDYKDYATINAAAVDSAISIVGNGNNNNYIVGGTQGNSLNGGDGDDTLVGNTVGSSKANLFYYTAGQDVIENFDESKDKLAIEDTLVAGITSGKLTNSRLTFTFDKKNDLTFKFGDNEPFESVSLNSGNAYLTKDGVVSIGGTSSLDLFTSAKGRIDLTETLYSGASIKAVDAGKVTNQTVTLVGGSQGGTFTYAANKKRDGFEYGGGSATITGYEGGRDRIDLNGASLTSFAVSSDDVVLNIGNGTGSISITSAKGEEVLLRDAGSRGYKKMVFADTGVVQNKKSNPTMVTVSSGASNYSVIEKKTPTVKKIFVTDIATATSIQAGDRVNTIIDASKAANTVSLSGGAKNDKLIGNTANADMFVYGTGKDVIQNFGGSDQISLTGSLNNSLESAKITASKKSIKFKFSNKDVLTIKSNDTMSGALTINDKEKIYFKNAIGDSTGSVSLTSGFSGTFRTQDTKRTALPTAKVVDGSKVGKNLTFVGSSANETLIGGNKKKTMFKGGGGADSLVGGNGGKDTFFYAKGNEGNATISKFEFGTDKIKVASGILGNVKQSGNTITFGMTKGKSTDAVVGSFTLDKNASKDVVIKANNTLYWFADQTTANANDDVEVGQLITSDTKISAPTGYDVIDLNYSTNLVKSGVAIKVTGAKPTTTT